MKAEQKFKNQSAFLMLEKKISTGSVMQKNNEIKCILSELLINYAEIICLD